MKKNKIYLLYRAYCIISVIAWQTILFISIIKNDERYLTYSFVFFVPLIYAVIPLKYYPFEYSIIGKMKRKKFPEKEAKYIFNNISLQIGISSPLPILSLYIFKEGIGILIAGFGKTYILFNEIEKIEKNKFGKIKIIYNNSEIRSPIKIYNDTIYDKLKKEGFYVGR